MSNKGGFYNLKLVSAHIILAVYCLIAILPIVLIIMNAFKERKLIFTKPYAVPDVDKLTFESFFTVFDISNLTSYLFNSAIVTIVSVAGVLLFAAMAAHALYEYRFRSNHLIFAVLILGIAIPIRLGTVAITQFMTSISLINTLTALILVYIAQGIPLAVFILREFISQVPSDLKNAARLDNVGEISIFFKLVLPMIYPALGTVAILTMLPIWNDLWFPLILAPAEESRTLTLGVQVFIAQFQSDWGVLFAALSLALFPILVLYILFARFLISGLTRVVVR